MRPPTSSTGTAGTPTSTPAAFTLDAESVAVIGVGNVAVDVARILARDPAELEHTDIPEPVMDALRASKVREVHVIGRRGPAQAKFTTKELRELGELRGVQCPADPAELDLTDGFDRSGESAALAAADRRVRGNLVAMAGWAGGRATATRPGASCGCGFWLRPVEIHASRRERWRDFAWNAPGITAGGAFEGTGEFETLDAQMVLRSVGYQSVPLPGVPFDERTHTVPNASGRVLSESGEPLPGEYVAGWLKRGPTGVIGTNKADAAETVQALLADLAGGPDVAEGKLPRPGLLRRPATTSGRSEIGRRVGPPARLRRVVLAARGRGAGVLRRLAPHLRGGRGLWRPRSAAATGSSCRTATRSGRRARPRIPDILSCVRLSCIGVTVRKNVTTPRHDGVSGAEPLQAGSSPRRSVRCCRRRSARRRGFEMLGGAFRHAATCCWPRPWGSRWRGEPRTSSNATGSALTGWRVPAAPPG